MKSLIVIPVYNEGKSIGSLIRNTKGYYPDVDILVVNDGSCDDTASVGLKEGVFIVTHPFNMGYGVALQTGYKYAARNGYDLIIQMDGDGQHDPIYISELVKQIEKDSADVIIGSRFISGVQYKASLNRKIGMILFSRLVSIIIRQRISDSTSGFQALNIKAVRFLIEDFYPDDYPDADVIIMLHRAGFRIKEIPLIMHNNRHLKSMHSGLKPIYYVCKMTLSIFVTLLRKYELKKEGG